LSSSASIPLNSRSTLVQQRPTLKNTVRGHLKSVGIRLWTVSHKQFRCTVRSCYEELEFSDINGIESLLDVYETLNKEIMKLDSSVHKLCKDDEMTKLLKTVPGVGEIVALSFKNDIGVPSE